MYEPDWHRITEAPRQGGQILPPFQYGPFVLVRSGKDEIQARWKSPTAGPFAFGREKPRWEGRWGGPLSFEPTHWAPLTRSNGDANQPAADQVPSPELSAPESSAEP